MIFKKIFDSVPDYKEFMTVDELDASSRKLAEIFKSVELSNIGESGSGRPILCLKIGNGKKNALLFAFPHPNEPIGSLTVEFLSKYLAENPDITNELDYTWYLIKADAVQNSKEKKKIRDQASTILQSAAKLFGEAGYKKKEKEVLDQLNFN